MNEDIKIDKVKLKHNYTSELELKSLLIRIKNDRANIGSFDRNKRINKYIKWHTQINAKKYDSPTKRNQVKNRIKDQIILLSEKTRIDKPTYERFGTVILLMIKNILRKPQFSGYTYKDDFYSDAVYKIIKYLYNFDHTLISDRTGTNVNAFAYISQYIHNSVLFVINSKKKEVEKLRKHISMEHLLLDENQSNQDWYTNDIFKAPKEENIKEETVHIKIKTTLVDALKKLDKKIESVTRLNVVYPSDYSITFEEYNELKDLLKGKVSITRAKE